MGESGIMTPRQREAVLKALRHNRKVKAHFAELGREAGSYGQEQVFHGMETMVRILYGVGVWLELREEVDREFDDKTKLNDQHEHTIWAGEDKDATTD